MNKFYLVWRMDTSQTRKKHATKEEAEIEALRLTEREGKPFIVLEAVSITEIVPRINKLKTNNPCHGCKAQWDLYTERCSKLKANNHCQR